MGLLKKFRKQVELVVIRDKLNPENIEYYQGDCLEDLMKQAFGSNGLSSSVKIHHGKYGNEVTPKTQQDVDKIMKLNGRFYAVVEPLGILNKAVDIFMQVTGLGWLMRQLTPEIPNVGLQTSPPSPNNALAARTNQQRLGGRIPDIFGTVYSVPDLIAVTYSVYIDHKEVEMSYFCIGRGKHHVFNAFDDTTPISQVFGSSVLIFDPDTTLEDEPSFQFGSAFTPDEAAWSRLSTKRYTSVNGQTLPAPDNYTQAKFVFKAPNIIQTSESIDLQQSFVAGDLLLIEGADSLASANGVTNVDDELETYTLNGQFEVLTVSESQITLADTSSNSGWQKLITNNDQTVETDAATLSSENENFWQGWYYSDGKGYDDAFVNIIAQALWVSQPTGKWEGLKLFGAIESEVVDVNNNPIAGTLRSQQFEIASPNFDDHIKGQGDVRNGGAPNGVIRTTYETKDEKIREPAGVTVRIENPNINQNTRFRIRVARTSSTHYDSDSTVYQEIKIKDFYSSKNLTAADYPSGVTTAYSKTLATEGALSLKERKLRLLLQRYVTDATSGLLKLSNRADDIIRHIATDPKIGNLQLSQVDIAQIKAEIDAQVAYFGTEKCSEFCYTFDDNNLSAEETLQTVSKAVFSQAKRQGNKIMLDFERIVPASVAVFNSHNILPDTFTASESLGIANDYDGVTVEYTDPADDATVTLSYPSDSLINPHEDKLIGVRNEVQAYIHMMRLYNKDRHAYKTCEFTAGDESNIVVRTNRITVADQLRANIQQGSVDSIETVGSDIVLYTTDPVSIEPSVPHTLFIQTINNGVEAIEVTARDDYSVKLARLPSGEISIGYDKVVQATYQIATEEDKDRDAYLVSQKEPSEAMTNKLTCTNYDDRYYQNDTDYINGLIA